MINKKKSRRRIINTSILNVDDNVLSCAGVTQAELIRYIPQYIISPTILYYGTVRKIWFAIIQRILKVFVGIFLRPRRESTGGLDADEVDSVYTHEADTYNWKHHITTRGMDLSLRRLAGWCAATVSRDTATPLKVLDLCTGTGLTVEEIVSILTQWGITYDIIGLDYNAEMLNIAERRIDVDDGSIAFVHGDATKLVFDGSPQDGMINFRPNTFDVITQMFGIGGVDKPMKVFEGVLEVLKPGGRFFMTDMHKPIPEFPGEWPLLMRHWLRFPIFEMVTYEQTTMPVVLRRLWAWRDTTLLFYLLPLVTRKDDDCKHYGFKVQTFEYECQRWWFSLPLMPTGKIIVEKVEIDEQTARIRTAILEACIPV